MSASLDSLMGALDSVDISSDLANIDKIKAVCQVILDSNSMDDKIRFLTSVKAASFDSEQTSFMVLDTLIRLWEQSPRELQTGLFFDSLLNVVRYIAEAGHPIGPFSKRLTTLLVDSVNIHECPVATTFTLLAVFDFLCLMDPARPFNHLLSLLRPSGKLSGHPVLLGAALNCLGHVLRSHPQCMARGLPTLIEWLELAGNFDGFSDSQKRNIEHSLRLQLQTLLPLAPKYVSLINEVLAKKRVVEKSKRPVEVEEADDIFSKRLKPSAAFADESENQAPSLDILRVSVPVVIKSILASVKRMDMMTLESRMESWRPSAPIEAGFDPRKRKAAEIKAFNLEAETYDLISFQKYLGFNFHRLLNGSTYELQRFGATRRKEWALLVSKYVTLINDPLVENQLLDYCFQDLVERGGLIHVWLKMLYKENNPALEQAFTSVLNRVLMLIEIDSTSTDIEEAIGDILVFAPGAGLESAICMFFMSGLGLADMIEPEEGEEPAELDPSKRSLLFRLLKRLLEGRPGYRASMANLVEEFVVSSSKDIRLEAVRLCSDTIKIAPFDTVYRELASKLIVRTDVEYRFELFLELLKQDLSLLSLVTFADEQGVAQFKAALPAILIYVQNHNPDLFLQLVALVPVATPAFLQVLVAALPSNAAIPTEFLDGLEEGLSSGRLAGSIAVSLCPKSVPTDRMRLLLKHMVIYCLTQTEGKEELSTCFQTLLTKPGLPLSPRDIFLTLLQAERDVGLKRCIEACNICFAHPAIWKPEILMAVFEALVDDRLLPVSFMRSVIQALTLHPKSLGLPIQALLSRLISLKVWEQPHLWEGWLRALKMLLPASLPVLLQLPVQQVQSALEHLPEAKAPLKEYLWQQPPSLRNRFSTILSLTES